MHRYMENLLLKLRERRASYSSRIMSGNFVTLEDYKFISGRGLGIDEAEEIAKSLYQDMSDRNMMS